MKTDGRLIRRKRIGLGHGVNRFAAIAGVSSAALSRIENGLRSPRPETLKKITDALGCQIHEVTTEEDSDGARSSHPAPPAENALTNQR